MAFCIRAEDASVAAAIRRVADEQIAKALDALEGEDQEEAVHQLRKRCKKLRGIVRLVRPAFPAYKQTNAFFRDTARIVDKLRDAKVMQDTYDALLLRYDGQVDRQSLGSIRRGFTMQRKSLRGDQDVSGRLARCRQRFVEARERAREWELEEEGWDALEGGIAKTYGRARKAWKKAMKSHDAEDLHDMRKRVKYHWMHARLLRPVWPDELEARADLAKELSDVLGDHHDLAVFTDRIAMGGERFGNPRDIETITALAQERSEALVAEADEMAGRLMAEKPDALTKRLGTLWDNLQAAREPA